MQAKSRLQGDGPCKVSNRREPVSGKMLRGGAFELKVAPQTAIQRTRQYGPPLARNGAGRIRDRARVLHPLISAVTKSQFNQAASAGAAMARNAGAPLISAMMTMASATSV